MKTAESSDSVEAKPSLVETLPLRERPAYRVAYQVEGCNLVELIAALVGGERQIEVAHELIGRFGSLRGLLRATPVELQGVLGVGPSTGARLRAALELGRRLGKSDENAPPVIQSPDDAANLVMSQMQHLEQEHLMVLLLDTRNRLIGEPVTLYHGSLNTSLVRIGEVFRPAIRANAAAILIAHNHPSGSPDPSPEDVAITRAIAEAGRLLDVECLDHLIIGQGRFVSLKSRGLGFP
jgi:DNA repair protein RadC